MNVISSWAEVSAIKSEIVAQEFVARLPRIDQIHAVATIWVVHPGHLPTAIALWCSRNVFHHLGFLHYYLLFHIVVVGDLSLRDVRASKPTM